MEEKETKPTLCPWPFSTSSVNISAADLAASILAMGLPELEAPVMLPERSRTIMMSEGYSCCQSEWTSSSAL